MSSQMTGHVENAGIDAVDRRPGVPMERVPPQPAGEAHWTRPDRQRDPGNVLRRKGLAELTPVFGTSVPPRGLSGLMRRAAYAIPEHFNSHWLILLLSDRVDALEHRSRKQLVPFGLAVGLLAFMLLRRRSG